MSEVKSLVNRINKMLTAIENKRLYTHLPVIMYSSEGDILYQTPEDQVRFKHLPRKVYIDLMPDEDGIEA